MNIDNIIQTQNDELKKAEQSLENMKHMAWKPEMLEKGEEIIARAEKKLAIQRKNTEAENAVLDEMGFKDEDKTMRQSELASELIDMKRIYSNELTEQELSADERNEILSKINASGRLIKKFQPEN